MYSIIMHTVNDKKLLSQYFAKNLEHQNTKNKSIKQNPQYAGCPVKKAL